MITSMVSDMILHSQGKDDVGLSDEVKEVMDIFRNFMFEHIYHSETLAHERRQAVFVLRELYEWFLKHFDELPKEFVQREKRWGRQKIVTDYVAGLTDSYAVQLFHEIYMPPVGFMVH